MSCAKRLVFLDSSRKLKAKVIFRVQECRSAAKARRVASFAGAKPAQTGSNPHRSRADKARSI
jgi:hypothetical protein